jgi:hypothetical protein
MAQVSLHLRAQTKLSSEWAPFCCMVDLRSLWVRAFQSCAIEQGPLEVWQSGLMHWS